MDPSNGATRPTPYPATRPESKGQLAGRPPGTPQGVQVLPVPPAGQALRQGLVQPADLPPAPRSSLPSLSPRLPEAGTDAAQRKGARDTKHKATDAKQPPVPADGKRFDRQVRGVEALARKVQVLVPPAGIPPGAVTAQAGITLTKALRDGFNALLRDARLDTPDDAVALLGALAPAVEANFGMGDLPGSFRPGAGLGTPLRGAAIGLLLTAIEDRRPLARDLVAEAILAHAEQPQAWVRALMLRPEVDQARPPYEAMLDLIVRIARARGPAGTGGSAGMDQAWCEAAVTGLAQAQQRQMEMADDLLKLSESGLETRLLAAVLSGFQSSGVLPGQVREIHARHLENGLALRHLACDRARELGPRALSVLVGGLTAQIERSAPSAGPALETQVASLVWQVMCSTGVDHPPVVALVQALDRGVTQALGTDAQATARACIRGGLVLALGRYYGELKPGLLPIAGGDAAMEARISDMLEASKAALLKAVDSQAAD